MSEAEIRLRLIEAAAALPGVRAGIDHEAQAQRAQAVAKLWYNYCNGPAPGHDKKQRRGITR